MQPALADPLRYPFGIPLHGFVIRDGQHLPHALPVLDTAAEGAAARIDALVRRELGSTDAVAFLTCGSNASPQRLAEKLRTTAAPHAVAVRLRVRDWVPAYAATLSYYGSVPATFEHCPGETAEPFLVVMDRANLAAMVASEQRTDNYDCYALPPAGLVPGLALPVLAFVCRFGALRLGGQVQRLRQFQPQAAGGVLQADVVAGLLGEFEPGTTIADYRERARDPGFAAAFKARIRHRFAAAPRVPGWQIGMAA